MKLYLDSSAIVKLVQREAAKLHFANATTVTTGAAVLLRETPDLIGVEKELFERCGNSRDGKNLEQFLASHNLSANASGRTTSGCSSTCRTTS